MRTLRATLFTLFFAIPYLVLGLIIVGYFYKDWYFWMLLGFLLLGIICFVILQWLPDD